MDLQTQQHLKESLGFLGFPLAEAERHATLLQTDLERFDIKEFRLLRPVPTGRGFIVEYSFGPGSYSINNARPARCPDFRPTDHGGTQVDRENLLFLVRTAEVARAAVPGLWLNPDEKLKQRFRHRHLDTLTEFWWLSRFRAADAVKSDQRVNPECNKDVDWKLSWQQRDGRSLTVNLEVKRRIGDVLRFAQGAPPDPAQLFSAGLEDADGKRKFRPSSESEINVLGVSLFGEIDRDVQVCAAEWVRSRSDIDILLLFTRFSARRSGFDVQAARKAPLLNSVLNRNLSELDLCLDGVVATPLPYALSQLPYLP